jgi:hypothetical protein
MAGRESAEFLVNQRREVVEGLFIAVGPLHQQLSHVVGGRHVIENTTLFISGNCTLVRLVGIPAALSEEKALLMIDFRSGLRVL